MTQPAADIGHILPPTSASLSTSFVAIFGQSVDDLRKCQLLHVDRDAYETLVKERNKVNPIYANVKIDEVAISAFPENGIPNVIKECACPLPECDRYNATREGPGTIRDPLDAAKDQDDASDEAEPEEASDNAHDDGVSTTPHYVNQFETPLGLDPTATPSYIQHLAAFQAQLNLTKDAFQAKERISREVTASAPATALGAAQEDCHRVVVDLRRAAQELSTHDFEKTAERLEKVDKGLHIPSTKEALSMFDPSTWTKCFCEFWYGDALPNSERPRKVTFEQLFRTLVDREELEYQLDSDETPYKAGSQSRFDTPEFVIVAGDTLRRLLMFRGTRVAFKRRGLQKDVATIAKATSEMCCEAYESLFVHAGGEHRSRNLNAERLARDEHVPKELQTAIRQMLISTKDVPFTDGSKRNLRHEGHNLNVTYGSLVVFATFNYADAYSPVLLQLLDAQEEIIGDIQFHLADDAPAMPTLQQMHRLIAQSPRAQAKFFLLMDDIADIYLMGMDFSFIGRHHVQQSFHHSSREDTFASTAIPSLGGYGIAELEPFESQERGFQHGHRKKYAIPRTREREVIELFKEKDEAVLRDLLGSVKDALLRCAETLQYEASTLPALQMEQSVSVSYTHLTLPTIYSV